MMEELFAIVVDRKDVASWCCRLEEIIPQLEQMDIDHSGAALPEPELHQMLDVFRAALLKKEE